MRLDEYLEPHLERLRQGEPASTVTRGLMAAVEGDIRAGRLTSEVASQLDERWRELAVANGHEFELAVARIPRPTGDVPLRSYDLGGERLVSAEDLWISLTSLQVYSWGLRLSARLEGRPTDPESAADASRRFLIELTETDTSPRLSDDLGTVRMPVRFGGGLTHLCWEYDHVDPAARRMSIEVVARVGPPPGITATVSIHLD